MDRFLPIGDFKGNDLDRPVMPPPFSLGQSHFKGVLAFTNVERATVEAMLPTGLTLAHNTGLPNFHPILHIVGLQGQTGWSFPDGELHRVDAPYQEFILMVPFTQRPGSSQWHNLVIRIYLDHEIAQEIGELFAYRKVIGFVKFDPRHMRRCNVMNGNGSQTFRSVDRPVTGGFRGPAKNARGTVGPFDDIVRVLDMPVMGIDPLTGAIMCSYFDLDFDAATVTAFDTQAVFTSSFAPGDLAGAPRRSVPGGALHVDNVAWSLQFPPKACGFLP